MIKATVCGDSEMRKKRCLQKEGRWDESTCTCVIEENKINDRENAIDNFIYRLCEEKVEDETYPNLMICMGKEGYARRKAMYEKPYQDQFLESKYIKEIMRETVLGDLRGYEKQYRYAGYIHGRIKGDLGIIQADKHPPLDIRHIPEYISYKLKDKQEEEILVFKQ